MNFTGHSGRVRLKMELLEFTEDRTGNAEQGRHVCEGRAGRRGWETCTLRKTDLSKGRRGATGVHRLIGNEQEIKNKFYRQQVYPKRLVRG